MSRAQSPFEKGTHALNRGLHRGADWLQAGLQRGGEALGAGVHRGADALDRGLHRGAAWSAERGARAAERARERLRRKSDPGRNPGGGDPNNAVEDAGTPLGHEPPGSAASPPGPSGEHDSWNTPHDRPNESKRTRPMCIFKNLLRIGVIGGVVTAAAVGGTVLVAGPNRSAALFESARESVLDSIDSAIDDPAALRTQLRELESQYPERIAMLRGDLAELNEQIRQLEREQAISDRVVALAERDLEVLQPQVAQAMSTESGAQLVSLENRVYTVHQAAARLDQIQQTRVAYSNRAADAAHDLTYLRNQATRVEDMLLQLETERTQFQAQLAALERQVDAVARNERLIGMLESRQKTLEECSRYEAASLDHIVARLGELRSRQEATLEYLTSDQKRQDYESLARMQLDAQSSEREHQVQGSDTLTVIR